MCYNRDLIYIASSTFPSLYSTATTVPLLIISSLRAAQGPGLKAWPVEQIRLRSFLTPPVQLKLTFPTMYAPNAFVCTCSLLHVVLHDDVKWWVCDSRDIYKFILESGFSLRAVLKTRDLLPYTQRQWNPEEGFCSMKWNGFFLVA
jgi:hypothetical protein